MKRGICLLCSEDRMLHDSHIWPQFAYKRGVTEQGGRMFDLKKAKFDTAQYRRFWLCTDCERRFKGPEDIAVRLWDRMKRAPLADYRYDQGLLKFAISVTWRTLRYVGEEYPRVVERHWNAEFMWRKFLLERSNSFCPYSIHIFNIVNTASSYDCILGGMVSPDEMLVVTHIGPFLIVGMLQPERFSRLDLAIWQKSRMKRDGGSLPSPQRWVVGGDSVEAADITTHFYAALQHMHHTMARQAIKGAIRHAQGRDNDRGYSKRSAIALPPRE